MSRYPSLQELIEKQDGPALIEVRRSMRSIMSHTFAFIFAIIVVYALNIFWDMIPQERIPFLSYLSPRWFSLVPALMLLNIIRRYHDDLYIFDLTKLTHFEGRLSLTYNVPNIRYSDLRAISVTQDLMGRLLNYGDIALSTAAQTETEIIIQGVLEPKGLARLIDDLRTHARDALIEKIEEQRDDMPSKDLDEK